MFLALLSYIDKDGEIYINFENPSTLKLELGPTQVIYTVDLGTTFLQFSNDVHHTLPEG